MNYKVQDIFCWTLQN